MRPDSDSSDALVIGTGPAGLASALALDWSGLTVTLVGPRPTPDSLARETRTTALFGGSVDLLRHLGAWAHLEAGAAPLTGLRLVDAIGGPLRAPETLFRANEIGHSAFGYNVSNAALVAALFAAAEQCPGLRYVDATVASVASGDACATAVVGDGRALRAALLAGADGRTSLCRAAAGVATEAWTYPQAAVTTVFTHTRPHGGISTELHRRSGPLTTVPMPGPRSSLVWVDTPDEAARLAALDEDSFARELEEHLASLLGTISDLGPRGVFPLSGLKASPLGRARIALIGEAGHVLPPIGAQGLNLGFRDAAWLAEIAGTAKRDGRDVGGSDVLAAYHRARAGDVATRSLAIDLLNRSLFTGLLPADLARGAGLTLVSAIGPLRRLVMREGMAPSGPAPRLLTAAGSR